jgi:hypothetical protein
VLDVNVPRVDALAVSDRWLVTRSTTAAGDALVAQPLADAAAARTIQSVRRPAQIGRPSLDGDVVVFHVATLHGSRIVETNLATSASRVVRRSVTALVSNPSLLGGRLLYARQTALAQTLELGPAWTTGSDRVLYRLGSPAPHDLGHQPGYSSVTRTPHPTTARWTLWTTALSPTQAYVTLLPRGAAAAPMILSLPR